MEEKHKVKMKLGGFELEAEGDQAKVDEQVRLFLEAVAKLSAAGIGLRQEVVATSEDAPLVSAATTVKAPDADTEPAILDRAFSLDREVVSLRVLPRTKSFAADSLLALLYGYRALRNEHDVLGTQLMKAARQSGLLIDRVDRVIAHHREFYNRGGSRRGARYALNNRGIDKAKEILKTLE